MHFSALECRSALHDPSALKSIPMIQCTYMHSPDPGALKVHYHDLSALKCWEVHYCGSTCDWKMLVQLDPGGALQFTSIMVSVETLSAMGMHLSAL